MALSGQFEGFPFLATKLRTPPEQQHLVPRARLTDALEHGFPTCKLILLSAPAGYGKTTLLAQWAHSSRFPVAWLSVGEEDNDAGALLALLAGGLGRRSGRASWKAAWGCSSARCRRTPKRFCRLSSTQRADEPDHLVFVLDDYHLIKGPGHPAEQ